MLNLDLIHETSAGGWEFIAAGFVTAILGAIFLYVAAKEDGGELVSRVVGSLSLLLGLGLLFLVTPGMWWAATQQHPTDAAREEHQKATELISDAVEDHYHVSHVNPSPPEMTPSLSDEVPGALSGQLGDAPWVEVVTEEGQKHTYRVMYDPETGEVELVGGQDTAPTPKELER